MFRRPYFSFSTILLIGLVALTLWLDEVTKPLSPTTDADFYDEPDYIIENISGLRIEHDKNTHSTFHAKKMLHYLNRDLTELEHIRFVHSKPEKQPFLVFADYAAIHNNGENIFLTGNVTAMRGFDKDKKKITLKTDMLHLIPGQDIVKTDKEVIISRLNTTINAIGLELDNQTGMIELLSRVRAVNQ
ncbi:MAG: LPS export ABC transporter periplasmic protein LptC [Burkholderiales bacterium]|nr:LPS export ABC transporter periplasmic protein LptC [Burkholderiales bacterium]MDR4515993.1 LPS export ABC transporter periplasmic protein LptC [Nitrosomonas sp.]